MSLRKFSANTKMYFIAALLLSLIGCGNPIWLPPAHKIEIQQGNLLSREQVAQLNPGMSREEVLAAVGQPVLKGSFHRDRWDYIYTRGPAGAVPTARSLSVHFDAGNVAKITDNHELESGEIINRKPWWRRIFRGSQSEV